MDINTVAELLRELANAENERLQAIDIEHRPTIGDMYEGLTQELLHKSLFNGLNLFVAKGSFIKGCQTEMDIILAEGKGEKVPYTDSYMFDPEQVLAVIQVKKTFNGKEVSDSYYNLKEISDLYVDVPAKDYMLRMAEDSLHHTLQRSIHDYEAGKLTLNEEYIRHSLITQAMLPVTIVLGYNGLKSEFSVRERYYEFLAQNITTEGNRIEGFGPCSFPSLVICEDTSLVKLMGCPFCAPLNREQLDGWWDFVGSSHFNPMYFLLEVIWSKLSYKYGLPSEIFGPDLETPIINPFLSCHAHVQDGTVIGWDYYYNYRTKEQLANANGMSEWSPIELNFLQYKVMNALCIEGRLKSAEIDEPLEEYEKYGYASKDELLQSLCKTGLVALDGEDLILIIRGCQVVEVGDHFMAADNNSGRFDNWLAKHSMELLFGIKENKA